MLRSDTSQKAHYEEDIDMNDFSLDFATDQTLNTKPMYKESMNEISLKKYQERSRSNEAKVFCSSKFKSPLQGNCWSDAAHLETK